MFDINRDIPTYIDQQSYSYNFDGQTFHVRNIKHTVDISDKSLQKEKYIETIEQDFKKAKVDIKLELYQRIYKIIYEDGFIQQHGGAKYISLIINDKLLRDINIKIKNITEEIKVTLELNSILPFDDGSYMFERLTDNPRSDDICWKLFHNTWRDYTTVLMANRNLTLEEEIIYLDWLIDNCSDEFDICSGFIGFKCENDAALFLLSNN